MNYDLWLLGLFCFMAFMAEGSMLDWSAEYLKSSLLYEPSRAGLGYAFFSTAVAMGRFLCDTLIKRYQTITIFRAGYLIAACGLTLVINGGWGGIELLGFFLIGIGAANGVPIIFSYSGKLAAISTETALTVVTTCGYGGLLLGPACIGYLAHHTSLYFALIMMALIIFALACCGKALQKATVIAN
ncbi:MAG: hypothetical protein LW832_02030 [Parachlamydia sp.]|nr:hypothetical protein [Parachlamydia sp.]